MPAAMTSLVDPTSRSRRGTRTVDQVRALGAACHRQPLQAHTSALLYFRR
jgi:hypothetical protein